MRYKNSDDVKNNSYINKDFQALWEELLDLVPKLTNKWDPRAANESDPLAMLLKLTSIYSDKLNYNIDKSILERFPQTLTERRSAINVYDTLGYKAPWYKAAVGTLSIYYNKLIDVEVESDSFSFSIPRFTMVCDEDKNIVYTITDSSNLTYNKDDYLSSERLKNCEIMQGKIHSYIINGVEQITADNLDSHNRLYFIEPNVAQNAIFISNTGDFTDTSSWVKIDNIYQTIDTKSYEFGIDPVTGTCYIEFPDTIANSIGDGLYIKYITTDGEDGNVKARSINKFYDESIKIIINGQEHSLQDNQISVVNTKAIQNGTNPATIDEMYENYKRVRNTFNTLVTLLDYENYLYRYEKSNGQNIVSNIRVSDRTNDLTSSYRIWTIQENQEALKIQDTDTSSDVLDANTIKFYPLNPISSGGINSKLDYDNTFSNNNFIDDSGETIASTFGAQDQIGANPDSLISAVNTAKVLTTNIKDMPYSLIVVPYNISGQIYLNHKVSQYVADEVKANVDLALYRALNSREINIGEEPKYEDILNIIQQADDRIRYVALDSVSFEEATLPNPINKLFVEQRAVLNGNTPWTNFDETFTYTPDQSGGAIKTFSAAFNNITINSNIDLDPTNATYYRVEQNEDLVLYAPDYKDGVTYSNYLYYKIEKGESQSSDIIAEENTPTNLPSGSNIYFYTTRDKAIGNTFEPCDYKITGGDKTYIRTNFELEYNENQGVTPPSLNNGKSISKIEHIKGSLAEPGVKIKWITNSRDAFNSLNSSSSGWSSTWDNSTDMPSGNAYTLKTGEYFIYMFEDEQSFTLLGEGNTLGSIGGLALNSQNTNGWFNTNWDKILEGDFSDISLATTLGDDIHYLQNQIYVFGEGYTFKFSSTSDNFSGWEGDGSEFEVGNSLQYSLQIPRNENPGSIEKWEALPKILDGDTWKGIIRLKYYLTNKGTYPLNYVEATSYVTHTQKLIVNNDPNSTFSPDSTDKIIYLQSNISLQSPGGTQQIISEDMLEAQGVTSLYIRSLKKDTNITPSLGIFYKFKNSLGNWIAPGNTSNYVVFAARSSVDGTHIGGAGSYGVTLNSGIIYYILARGGTSYAYSSSSTENSLEISSIKLISDGNNTYIGKNRDSSLISSLLPAGRYIIRLRENSGDNPIINDNFNVVHNISKNDLIETPTDSKSFFNKNHPLNRYAIAKINSLDGLQINSNSINS